ncbi:hypothetical protein NM688_g7596 [Phlebia brevispora]|uniref:Uncharacterized protein n=1 Tax=Phlebia brevispora TaxID=194682 RepID=A0ACC1S3I0_9APHY|nr:hypothetical protein NM688_g7596 [Phlebia brevispora]
MGSASKRRAKHGGRSRQNGASDRKDTVQSSAAHFLPAFADDLLPTNPELLEDYGFNRLFNSRDSFMLFGLYKGLWQLHPDGLEPSTVDKWLREGSLVQKIKETFERLPPDYRGEYYKWFLEHQWVLDGSPIPATHSAETVRERMRTKLWEFLGPERRACAPHWSAEWKICLSLYYQLLSDFYPAPHHSYELYVGFGYCVARDLYTEMAITRLYRALTERCAFEEFCDAYETSTLIALMEKRSIIETQHSLPRHFAHVMGSRTRHESVWSLKQYLYGKNAGGLELSVLCDYGFANCNTRAEEEELAATYRTAFDHRDFDEMELHRRCIRGETLKYIGKFQELSNKKQRKLARLTRNPYPLPLFDNPSVDLQPPPPPPPAPPLHPRPSSTTLMGLAVFNCSPCSISHQSLRLAN